MLSYDIASTLPLHAADAMIAIMTLTTGVTGLITLDWDMMKIEHLPKITTTVENQN